MWPRRRPSPRSDSPTCCWPGTGKNEQRLTKSLPKGARLPCLLTGASGNHNLHSVVKVVDAHSMIAPIALNDQSGETVMLERYRDDRHDFLQRAVTPRLSAGRQLTVSPPHEPYDKPARMSDYFEREWHKRDDVPSHL